MPQPRSARQSTFTCAASAGRRFCDNGEWIHGGMFAPGVGAVFRWLQKIVDIHRGLGIMVLFRGCGGIGRRVRLRIWWSFRP